MYRGKWQLVVFASRPLSYFSRYNSFLVALLCRGSCIAKIVGSNVQRLNEADPARWQPTVAMWVYEEVLEDGRKLSEVINTDHENVK